MSGVTAAAANDTGLVLPDVVLLPRCAAAAPAPNGLGLLDTPSVVAWTGTRTYPGGGGGGGIVS